MALVDDGRAAPVGASEAPDQASTVRVSIVDCGVGCDPATVSSAPGEGTRVDLIWPA